MKNNKQQTQKKGSYQNEFDNKQMMQHLEKLIVVK